MQQVRLRSELRGAIIVVEDALRNVKPNLCACIARQAPRKAKRSPQESILYIRFAVNAVEV
jgi:hypothetical protein